MEPLRIALVHDRPDAVSETFIRAHAERLPGIVAVFHCPARPSCRRRPDGRCRGQVGTCGPEACYDAPSPRFAVDGRARLGGCHSWRGGQRDTRRVRHHRCSDRGRLRADRYASRGPLSWFRRQQNGHPKSTCRRLPAYVRSRRCSHRRLPRHGAPAAEAGLSS